MDMNDDIVYFTLNNTEYYYNDDEPIYIPVSSLIGQPIKDLPFNITVDICDSCDNNRVVSYNVPAKILQESDGIFKVQFDESTPRKFWFKQVGLDLWMETRQNVVTKLFNAKIDDFNDEDDTYIQFYYSIIINANTFDELFSRLNQLYIEIENATDIALGSPLGKLEYQIINELISLKKNIIGKNENSLEYYLYKKELPKLIEKHLKENNPDKLLREYKTFFADKTFHKKIIKKGERFFRGRIGKTIIQGAIDDCNREFILPYHGKNMNVPPSLYTSGGRFNRAGTAYLYLATDLETCLAEVHLQVGQHCSIAEFECIEDIELINLSDFRNDLELKVWHEEITRPIHEEIRHKYLVTQFMSEVFMQFNSIGLYFKSVQSNGDNIVCFQPDKFQLVQYSEKIYVANSINYTFSQVDDAIREFANNNKIHLINSYNSENDDYNEQQVNYMLEWIENERTRTKP